MLEQLMPQRRHLTGEDPIFLANAEASRRRLAGEDVVNATIGALQDDLGRLVVLDTVMDLWADLGPMDIAPYAPIIGDPDYLTALIQRHWPDRADAGTGCATPGGSGALMLSLKNFLEPGMALLTAAPYWGPYLTISAESGVRLATAPFPQPGERLDAEAWHRAGSDILADQGRLLVWLNEPCHNPTSHSLTPEDREALHGVLRKLAKQGPVTLLLDCAYLDYTTDPAHVRAALDQHAAFAQEGTVLVGACLSLSKCLTLYGARSGALVFPWTRDPQLQAALAVSCRGVYSNCNRAPMALLTRLHRDGKAQEHLAAEHRHWSEVLESRTLALDTALRAEGLPGSPWKGGFFLTLRVEDPVGLTTRLKAHGVFVVPMPEAIRVGICALKAADAPRVASALRACVSP